MEIITGVERRRRWRLEDKLRIVAEAEAPGAVIALVARRHEVTRGQLFKWRGEVRRGELAATPLVSEFIPMRVVPGSVEAAAPVSETQQAVPPPRQGVRSDARRIEIVLPDGTCVRVDEEIGAASLRRVMMAVRR